MTAVASDSLQQTIVSENALIQQFVALLEKEQLALTSGKTDELPPLVEEKEELASELNALSQQRGNSLTALGYGADRPGMEAWQAANPEQGATVDIWKQTLSLAAKARELNRVNSELVQMHLQYNSNALGILLCKQTPLDLYGPDGRPSLQGGSKIDDSI